MTISSCRARGGRCPQQSPVPPPVVGVEQPDKKGTRSILLASGGDGYGLANTLPFAVLTPQPGKTEPKCAKFRSLVINGRVTSTSPFRFTSDTPAVTAGAYDTSAGPAFSNTLLWFYLYENVGFDGKPTGQLFGYFNMQVDSGNGFSALGSYWIDPQSTIEWIDWGGQMVASLNIVAGNTSLNPLSKCDAGPNGLILLRLPVVCLPEPTNVPTPPPWPSTDTNVGGFRGTLASGSR